MTVPEYITAPNQQFLGLFMVLCAVLAWFVYMHKKGEEP